MEFPKILSGEELVSRGVTTIFATLPEIGLKDVLPNGSWLEIKQIQAALEARKNLIDVERIEKFGTLSQAEWRDDLRLAEVTRHTGSHWQFFGHNIGKKLYIKCEEILFLMEVNCLQLKHNDITVSLQKAYSLLLDETFTINQYKVYASLSRLGYKVFRHKGVKDPVSSEHNFDDVAADTSENCDIGSENIGNIQPITTESSENTIVEENIRDAANNDANEVSSTITDESLDNVQGNNDTEQNISICKTVVNNNTGEQNNTPPEEIGDRSCEKDTNQNPENSGQDANNSAKEVSKITINNLKIKKLSKRRGKTNQDMDKYFEDIPEMANKDVIFVSSPEDIYIPQNIFVSKTSYKLNLKILTVKEEKASSEDGSTSSSDAENLSIETVRTTPSHQTPSPRRNMPPFYTQMRFSRIMQQQFRPYPVWRPHPQFNMMTINSIYPRPVMANQFHSRFPFNIRPHAFLRPFGINVSDVISGTEDPIRRAQKRRKDSQAYHYRTLKTLAGKVRSYVMTGNIIPENSHYQAIQTLQKLIHTFNSKFGTCIRLNEQFELIDAQNDVETVELEDEHVSKRKKPRLEKDTFNENLNKLRELALKLKVIASKGLSTSRHRRAFSNAIKTFNKSNNADVYLNDNYEVIDRRHITLDSSSDTQGDSEKDNERRKEVRKMQPKKKKLRNPFYLLKKLSEQENYDSSCPASTSNAKESKNKQKSEESKLMINENWLPKADDFGTMEMCCKSTCTVDSCFDSLLYDFLKCQTRTYSSWVKAKLAFFKYTRELHKQYSLEQSKIGNVVPENRSRLQSIIKPEDCSDMPTNMEKLRIINTNTEYKSESSIKIHFDVYHRDVQNFKKTNPPKPHFRIVCLDDSSKLPSGEDVASLNAKYEDDVDVVYAIVGVGSISYLQINPMNIPVYIPCGNRL